MSEPGAANDYPRPAVTVDVVLLTVTGGELQALLIRRSRAPFGGRWSIPGGFVDQGESLEAAAARELAEETGLAGLYLEQLQAFGDPGRDPRGWVITVAYLAFLPAGSARPQAGDDAADTGWFPVGALPLLAFDHARILDFAVSRLRERLAQPAAGFQLLSGVFTLAELRRVYEVILDRTLDPRRFRRAMLAASILVPADGQREAPRGRPAQRYRYDTTERGAKPEMG